MSNLTFEEELALLIKRRGLEKQFANTPDYILAGYIMRCLDNFAYTVKLRDKESEYEPEECLHKLF